MTTKELETNNAPQYHCPHPAQSTLHDPCKWDEDGQQNGRLRDIPTARPDALKDIRNTLHSDMQEAQSVNQTMFELLRTCPIVLSIETKLPFSEGETADVQLATWTGAGLTRLRQMLSPSEPIPTIPTLSMYGHDLYLMAFQEQLDANYMYGKLRLGGSDTLLGTFQMLRALGFSWTGRTQSTESGTLTRSFDPAERNKLEFHTQISACTHHSITSILPVASASAFESSTRSFHRSLSNLASVTA